MYTDYIYQGPMILVLLVRTWVGAGDRAQWGGAINANRGQKGPLCLEVGATQGGGMGQGCAAAPEEEGEQQEH